MSDTLSWGISSGSMSTFSSNITTTVSVELSVDITCTVKLVLAEPLLEFLRVFST